MHPTTEEISSLAGAVYITGCAELMICRKVHLLCSRSRCYMHCCRCCPVAAATSIAVHLTVLNGEPFAGTGGCLLVACLSGRILQWAHWAHAGHQANDPHVASLHAEPSSITSQGNIRCNRWEDEQ